MAYWTKFLRKALPFTVLLLLGLLEMVFSKQLKVHIIVNSHMDLGWVNTVSEYFFGQGTRYGEYAENLFNNLFQFLGQDQNRTYSMSELGFLEIWWGRQNQDMKNKVLKLIEQGQLEIINGGWVGNDEATAMYDDIIENFVSGQRWAKENLNTNSTVGWQMDSFGTSMTQAYLLKEAGYEGTFFSRADNDERQRRKDSQSLDFNWNFPNGEGSMYTQLLSRPYYKPILPRARWIAELGMFSEYDYPTLIEELRKDATYFNTNNVILLFCGDFWIPSYEIFDEVIKYFKNHPEHEIDAFYSNPGRYVREVKEELEAESKNLPDKHGDFFPLNEEPGTVWSGFFSSKSAFKGYVRWHSRYLTAAKLILSQRAMQQFETSNAAEYAALNVAFTDLEKAIAIVQHHDAVSGTMKEHVRFDYEDILTRARNNVEAKLREILLECLKTHQPQDAIILPLNSTYDGLLEGLISPEISKSGLPADSDLLLTVMNPGNKRLFLITANTTSTPTSETCITIESSDGRIISPDIICQEAGSTTCTIYFTDTIEAYAWMYYQVKVTSKTNGQDQCGALLNSEVASSGKQIKGSYWALQIDDGNVFTFLKNQNGNVIQKQFKLSYSYYESATQDRGKHHASGAYIFMPRSPQKMSLSTENQTVLWTGNHLAIVQIQSVNFTTTFQFLLEQEQTGFSVITQLAPINNAPNGCEIVMEITVPDLQTDGKFFTDTNGYFMLERPYTLATPQETLEDEISKNYHPITTRCSLEGNHGTEAFTIFTDRAQGTMIQKNNQVNIMIHRVAVTDDDEGVDEVLDEKDRNTSKPLAITTWHYFLWSDISSKNSEREETQYDSERPIRIWLFSVNNAFSVDSIPRKNDIPTDFPRSLKVNTRTYKQNDHSIRLQNLDPNNKLSVWLSGVSNNSPSLISYLSQNNLTGLSNITETYWTTTQVKEDGSQFDLKSPITIELAPLQMRTFKISVGKLDESSAGPEVVSGNTNPTPTNTNNTSNNSPDNSTNATPNTTDNTPNVPPTNHTESTPDNSTNTTPSNSTESSSDNTTNATPDETTDNTTGSNATPNRTTDNTPNANPNNTTNNNPDNSTNAIQNNTTGNATNSTIDPDMSDAKPDKEETPAIPEVQEAVSTDHGHNSISNPLIQLGYYIILHASVGIVYFIWCHLKARKLNIPLETYQKDILIVAAMGPIGLAVLCYLKKDENQVKHVILP